MLEHRIDTATGILYLRPKGALEKEDFLRLAKTVDPYLEAKGELAGIIIDAPQFPGWESLGAMVAHFRFVRDHQKRVKKIAPVTDAKLGDFVEKVAAHFVCAKVKRFPAGETQAAEKWILGS